MRREPSRDDAGAILGGSCSLSPAPGRGRACPAGAGAGLAAQRTCLAPRPCGRRPERGCTEARRGASQWGHRRPFFALNRRDSAPPKKPLHAPASWDAYRTPPRAKGAHLEWSEEREEGGGGGQVRAWVRGRGRGHRRRPPAATVLVNHASLPLHNSLVHRRGRPAPGQGPHQGGRGCATHVEREKACVCAAVCARARGELETEERRCSLAPFSPLFFSRRSPLSIIAHRARSRREERPAAP